MAQRRFISKSISLSSQVDLLSDRAALLFTWMLPHADDEGCMRGEPKIIKGTVVPLRSGQFWTEGRIEKYLISMAETDLIYYWWQAGFRYVQFTGWKEHQTIQTDRAVISQLPTFNKEKAVDASKLPDFSRQKEINIEKIKNLIKLDTQYKITTLNLDLLKRNEYFLSHSFKNLEKKAVEKTRDPRIARIISYFVAQTNKIKNFTPEIKGAQDGYMVKLRLQKYSESQIHELINQYLEAEVSNKLGASLSVCLSTTIVNQWLSGVLKKKKFKIIKLGK